MDILFTPRATEAALSSSPIKLIQRTLRVHVEKLSMTANIVTGNCIFNQKVFPSKCAC